MRSLQFRMWAIAAVALAFLAPVARAQDVTVEASADRTAGTLEDAIRLDIRVRGPFQGRPELRAPELADFRVASSGESQSYSIVNGQMSASYTFTFVLFPQREGDLVIPVFSVFLRGQEHKTEPIRVQVSGQSLAPAPGDTAGEGKDLFVVARVDKEKAYVNEQILYTFYLYYAVRVSNLNYTPPKFEGFWVEKLQEGEKQYHKIVNGRRYLVVEVSTAVFPTTSGTLEIEPSVLRLVEIAERSFSFFDRGVERVLRSRPTTVTVLPLPAAGRPADFDGAVGEDMELVSRVDRHEIPEGEPVTMTVTVSGSGNVRTFSKPRLPELPAFKTYDADSKSDVLNLDRVSGTRTYEVVLVPRGPGEFTIPPVRLSYFDTGSDSYKTLQTEVQRVTATPVAGGTPQMAGQAPLQQDIEVLSNDISHIRTDVPVSDTWTPLYAHGMFLVLAPLPLLAVGGVGLLQRRRRRFAADVALARSSRARAIARKRLAQAERLLADGKHQEFYAEAQRAVLQYVGDKLNAPVAGLTHAALRQQLDAAHANEDTRERLVQLLEHCDAARFAPGSFAPERMRSTLQEVESLVMTMEEGWGRKPGRSRIAAATLLCVVLAAPGVRAQSAARDSTEPSLHVQQSPAEYVPAHDLLQRGHVAYESGRYAEAVAAYELAEAQGVRNGPLYYDLGNAYFKSDALGRAIASYRRAERLIPRDPMLRANLDLVLARREDRAVQSPVPFPLSAVRALYSRMSINEMIVLVSILYVIVAGLLVLRILGRDRRFGLRLGSLALMVLLVLGAATLAYKIHDERGIERAVVDADKVAAMSGPGSDYTVEFWLHEGSEVLVEETRPDWLRVSLGAKLHGWIPARSVVRI